MTYKVKVVRNSSPIVLHYRTNKSAEALLAELNNVKNTYEYLVTPDGEHIIATRTIDNFVILI